MVHILALQTPMLNLSISLCNESNYKCYINQIGAAGKGSTPSAALLDWLNYLKILTKLYANDVISASKLAEELGISLDEAIQLLKAENIDIKISCSSLEELQQDVQNA